ncbi:hypothetical protein ABKV19_008489 [Rosa sericea]
MAPRSIQFYLDREKEKENFNKMDEVSTELATGRAGFYLDYTLRTDAADYQKYFQPRVVTFGPVHHGQPKYERAEKFKLIMAGNFIRYSDQQRHDLLSKIADRFYVLRASYNWEVTKKYDNDYLAWMFFIDGCSMLQFIHERHTRGSSQAPFDEQDLFLLENQIPYEVLRLLMESSTKFEEFSTSVHKFVQRQFSTTQSAHESNSAIIEIANGPVIETYSHTPTPTPTHLLDLLRKLFSGDKDNTVTERDMQRSSTFALLN